MATRGIVQQATQNRREDEITAIKHGEVITTGTRKDVYKGLRGMVKPMPEEKFVEENHEKLTHTHLVADAEINDRDLTEIGLWKNTKVINQQEADYTVEEAVEELGTDYVIETTVENLLDEFTERGLVYSDPGSNIGFFNGQPKAFDVYDDSSFEIYEGTPEEMSDADFHSFCTEAPVMYQKFAGDVARYSDQDMEEVVDRVAESSTYLETGEADITDFQQAFEYHR